MDELTMSYELG